MDEMNLSQIENKLNEEFSGPGRKLIFWYDSDGEFAEDIDSLQLQGASLYKLTPTNQFYTKYFLEIEDTQNSYLLYAPFAKPDIKQNHLADTLRYSKEFFADKTSLICLDLGIREALKPVIQRHLKFFASKQRMKELYAMEKEYLNTKDGIEVALMSVLCKAKYVSFDEVVRIVLLHQQLEENPWLEEFEKYDLLVPFWEHCERELGYRDPEPTLGKLVLTLFTTFLFRSLHCDLPGSWTKFLSTKAGSVMTFMATYMNSSIYAGSFDALSALMEDTMDAGVLLRKMPVESLVDCSAFACIDHILIQWMVDRVINEDMDTRLDGQSIPELCAMRSHLHFGPLFADAYGVVASAYHLVSGAHYTPTTGVNRIADKYVREHFKVDMSYRKFYYHFDRLQNPDAMEALRDFVENLYKEVYLQSICVNWSRELEDASGETTLDRQMAFYDKHVAGAKDRLVVIISDAMRYEVGYALYEKLCADEKSTASISSMISTLPSFTQFGMAALLPHRHVTISDDYQVAVDGESCDNLAQRTAILQKRNAKSTAVRFDDIKGMNQTQLREVFTGKELVYVYHNQIDARGDKASSEDEVFAACEEAVNEIHALMRKLSSTANTQHFIITADHGFLYRRSLLTAGDKIAGIAKADRRSAIADAPVDKEGVVNIPMSDVLGYADSRYVLSPMGADLFNAPGAGLNYTHGGCSPQEMLIPLVEAKLEKSKVVTKNARIDLIIISSKITNLVSNLDFVQTEPVSDTVKATRYRACFMEEDGTRISNENTIVADKTDPDSVNRKFRVRFSFKDQQYSAGRKYYLVVVDEKTDMEILRKEFRIDIAFANDYGF